MNVRLKKKLSFDAGVVFENQFLINHYDLALEMYTNTTDSIENNIAYERIRYWVAEILNGSVIIPSSSELLEAYAATGQRLITLPEQAVDQVIGIMLYCKLNAITEDRLIITDVEISSSQGDNMIYCHSDQENLGPFVDNGWWNDPRPKHAVLTIGDGSNVIKLAKTPDWKELGMSWHNTAQDSDTVVFADFKKDETE